MAYRTIICLLALCGMVAGTAQAAGTVKVQFVEPERYADIGFGTVDRHRNLEVLAAHMKRWEAKLPDGQELDVDVLDIDLAGDVKPWTRWRDTRVLTGRADAPRMTLRWALKSGGQTLKSGEERLSDLGYFPTTARLRSDEMLAYDKRMLDDWLNERVIGAPAGAR
jgi:hypothetical protein